MVFRSRIWKRVLITYLYSQRFCFQPCRYMRIFRKGHTTSITGTGFKPLFQWESVSGAGRYQLTVFDEAGEPYWAWEGAATQIYVGGRSLRFRWNDPGCQLVKIHPATSRTVLSALHPRTFYVIFDAEVINNARAYLMAV